ncbi:Yvc1p [Sugiyamaella lignohabitans]|uniref:Yvc1p n=1 Tax=Sugiyamaella lignohabitans TaxID=796027 RepID=A0A167EV52_9ASCO|nr:Yvc1p [Sugiyamaella lignohabitans]ANB14498.1 Yvc1p [Sugiyamaella lignohabitans]
MSTDLASVPAPLVPAQDDLPLVQVSPKQVLKIALRVKKLIDTVVPIQLTEEEVIKPSSIVLTEKIFQLILEAAGGKGDGAPGTSSRRYRATLVFVLLVIKKWNRRAALSLLYDSDLYNTRAFVAECYAKRILDTEQDEYYMFRDMLCQRYSITVHGSDSAPANALELAADLHSTVVIGSSGYQRCMKWLWRGWMVQSDQTPTEYDFYAKVNDPRFWSHFDPDRIKTPKYQNYIQLLVSLIYLAFYSYAVNNANPSASLIASELWLYLFTFGFILDEINKLLNVGYAYIGFWNTFNDTLYILVVVAFGFRCAALTYSKSSDQRLSYDLAAYHILSCAAPLIWGRLLLFLDSVRFFGAMLIVLKELMKESIIFFVLLVVVAGGFLQAFIGLDIADGTRDVTMLVVQVMTRTVLDGIDFEWMDGFAPPYGEVLYYIFTFLVSTLLLNILVALFNSAYQNIYDNATDEYLASMAQKTLRFIRAPDENVFIPPLNLLELAFLILPFEWWMDASMYQRINRIFMSIIYSPFLLLIAVDEAKAARRVLYNRSKGVHDDANEEDEEWDLFDGFTIDAHGIHSYGAEAVQMEMAIEAGDPEFKIDEDAFQKKVEKQVPNFDPQRQTGISAAKAEELIAKIDALSALVEKLTLEKGQSSSS